MTRPLSHHRRSLERMIRDNASANVSKVHRLILDGIDAQARELIKVIAGQQRSPMEGPYGSMGILGLYGGTAAIEDLIRQAAIHRKNGAERKAA